MNEYYNSFNETAQQGASDRYSAKLPNQNKKNGGARIAALALCFSLLGGAIGTGGTYLVMNSSESSTSPVVSDITSNSDNKAAVINTAQIQTAEQTDSLIGTTMTASEVYKANVDSTVGITTSISTNRFGYRTTAAASGSGFIISKDGYIVTNHHVIEDSNSITVTLYDGRTFEAKLIGSDESNDVAVLKIEADDLKPVTLGSSEALSVGDDVAAIGNPLGELTFSLTKGVVSALDRTVTTEDSVMTLIQTDAAINSGNSGGALFNMNGEVVGITNAKYSSSGFSASVDNIGFAIPIDNVKSLIESLISTGHAVNPYIGVGTADVGSDDKQDAVSEGAVIKKVYDDSPAQQAGIEEGDIVTEINGSKIRSSGELTSAVKASAKGDTLVLKVYRDGSFREITVTVGESSTETENSKTNDSKNNSNNDSDQFDRSDPFGGMQPGFPASER